MALLVAGCADSDEWMAVQAGSEALAGTDGQDSLAFQVSKAGWSDSPTTVTRAYETLEDLRIDTSQKWDFTSSMSSVDLTNLTSDAENWLYDSEYARYSNKKAFSGEVTVNGVKLGLTEGLSFGNIGESNFHIRPGTDIQMGGTSQVLTIPNLKQGQTVTIEFVSANTDYTYTLTPSNLTGDTGFGTDVSTTKHKGTGTVTADGSVTFTTTGAVNIYSIEISRRLDDGFGIYCSRMGLDNQQVVWDANASRWYYGDDIYWPRSQGRKYVSFNNSKTMQSEGSYFNVTGGTIDTKFNSCVYRGVTYTSGLGMVEGTAISFTSENLCNVIIVQSNWSAFTLKFDEVEIPMSTASGKITIDANTYDYTLTTIPGGRVYTIYEVAAGSHTIKRGSGESGVLYVSVERCFTVHAYAPYKGTSPYTFDEANHALTFATDANGKAPVDLLYACDKTVSQSSGETILDFKHALARVAFGTIGNTKGAHDMLVTNIGVRGTYYTSGNLDLNNGTWSGLDSGSETTVNVVDELNDEFIFVASGDQKMVRTTQVQADYSVEVKDVEKPMFIPGPTVDVTFKFYEQPDLVSLDDDMFHVWDGRGAGAAITATPLTDKDDPAYSTYAYYNNLGVGLDGGGTIIGSSTVHHLAYADLSAYDKLIIIGTPGLGMRVLMNRMAKGESSGSTHYNGKPASTDDNGGDFVETLVNVGVDGYVVLDLTWLKTLDSFVHLNCLKVHWGSISGTVSRLLLLKRDPEPKTVNHTTTLEQGKSAVFNLAVGRNFEVEIDGGASRLMNNE